jgi:hypothetical protein
LNEIRNYAILLQNFSGKSMVKSIHTLGDSTLDNLFWMFQGSHLNVEKAKKSSVEGALQERVKSDDFEVISHAYDGFTTRSVLEGDTIGAVLPARPEKNLYMKVKASQGTFVRPLDDLKKRVSKSPDSPHYVVISVGGNDFRANLLNPCRFVKDIPKIQKRYMQIVDQVKGLQGRDIRPILMLQYRTDANNDPYCIYPLLKVIGIVVVAVHVVFIALLTAPIWIVAGQISLLVGGILFLSAAAGLLISRKVAPLSITKDILSGKKISMVVMGALLHSFYKPILEKAKKERIPVLDLPNTFNPYEKLYESGIEPGKEGSKLIAEGIHHIVKSHDFTGESFLYSKPGRIPHYTRSPNTNPSSWHVAYPS